MWLEFAGRLRLGRTFLVLLDRSSREFGTWIWLKPATACRTRRRVQTDSFIFNLEIQKKNSNLLFDELVKKAAQTVLLNTRVCCTLATSRWLWGDSIFWTHPQTCQPTKHTSQNPPLPAESTATMCRLCNFILSHPGWVSSYDVNIQQSSISIRNENIWVLRMIRGHFTKTH